MIEIEVAVAEEVDLSQAAHRLEAVCVQEGLRITLRGTLAKYPGSLHWHLKYGRERGTLEVTLWPSRRRVWFKVSAGRTGAWIQSLLPRLKAALESAWSDGESGPAASVAARRAER